jgi:hypothetical protein
MRMPRCRQESIQAICARCPSGAHERLDDVVEERPAGDRRQLLEVQEVPRPVCGGERHLHEALVPFGEHFGELDGRLVVHDVGHHRPAVVVALHGGPPVGREALRRPAAAARVHRLVKEPTHLAVLGGARLLARLGAVETHHPDEERRDRHVRQHVDGLPRAIDALEELGVRHPVPRQSQLHRFVRDRFDARHRQHRALAHLGTDRREAEAAVADHHRRHAVPPGERQVRVPEELCVVVRMEVDEARRDDHAARVEDAPRVGGLQTSDRRDPAAADGDVGAIALRARAVDHDPVLQYDVELGHRRSPASVSRVSLGHGPSFIKPETPASPACRRTKATGCEASASPREEILSRSGSLGVNLSRPATPPTRWSSRRRSTVEQTPW